MIGSFSALKASRISPRATARLIAPTTTGLRSRKGTLISGPPRRCSAAERSGGDEEPRGPRAKASEARSRGVQRRGVRSSEVAPARAGVVADRDGVLAETD